MKLAFVVDPLGELKAYKDSSIAMMREAARRGHEIHAFEARDIVVRDNAVMAPARRLEISADDHHWYRASEAEDRPLADFRQVFMRKDPPFDQEYYYATLLLGRAKYRAARPVPAPVRKSVR